MTTDILIAPTGSSEKARFVVFAVMLLLGQTASAQELFREDFERDLSLWYITKPASFALVDSGDRAHGKVLKMNPGGGTHSFVLMQGSEKWGSIRVEGDVLFPDNGDNYMGLMYNFTERDPRIDYASIYIKGNGSYIQANPRLDGNPMREILPEYQTPLRGVSAITIGQWQHFKAEIIGSMCHFYVGDMETPILTFDFPYLSGGHIGFKPRVAGWPVWIDNISITSISSFHYTGPPRPDLKYEPEQLVTNWDMIGPFAARITAIEAEGYVPGRAYSEGARIYRWQKFETDRRGGVLTSRIVEFMGARNRAYFHTTLKAEKAGEVELQFSSVDELLIWVNGEFWGFMAPASVAWYDFWKNPEHANRRQNPHVQLKPGDNHLLIMVNGGAYADAGFFLHGQPKTITGGGDTRFGIFTRSVFGK